MIKMKKIILITTILVLLMDTLLIFTYVNSKINLINYFSNLNSSLSTNNEPINITPLTQNETGFYNDLSRIVLTLNLGELINPKNYYNNTALELIGFNEPTNVITAFAEDFNYTNPGSNKSLGSGMIYAIRLINKTDYVYQFINNCKGNNTGLTNNTLVISLCFDGDYSSAITIKNLTLYGAIFTNISNYRPSLNQLYKMLE